MKEDSSLAKPSAAQLSHVSLLAFPAGVVAKAAQYRQEGLGPSPPERGRRVVRTAVLRTDGMLETGLR